MPAALTDQVTDAALKDRLRKIQPKDWRAAMHSRFIGSVVLDCAVDTFKQARMTAMKAMNPPRTVNPDDAGVEAMVDFLTSLGDQRSRAGENVGSDLAIASVLAQYERLYRHYPALPGDKNIWPELCTLILKHLSIICGPVETAIFLHCPEIQDFLKGKRKGDRLALVYRHLAWLENHSLIFRIKSRSEMSEDDPDDIRFIRFVVHQSLQGYFFHRIGSAHVELGDSRLFAVSAYPIQPSGVPTPSFETYNFIIALLRRLISYPSKGWRQKEYDSEADRREGACALRAGVSLTRSAFSLAVVSRFSEYASEREGRSFGFMEEYRLLLRWMIFQAGVIGDSGRPKDDAGIDTKDGIEAKKHWKELLEASARHGLKRPKGNGTSHHTWGLYKNYRFNALYQDEVTWLYNECALVSYVQGNIPDALALYNRAFESNRLVETKTENGPNALRIRLNRAICEIDRGLLDRANEQLREIWRQEKREPVVAAAARGYMGLVAHLKRRVDQARGYYAESIEILRRVGEARALSIMQRHSGDLERPLDPKKARILLLSSLSEAETARQQDLVHRTLISIARCDLASGSDDANKAPQVLRRLEDVMRYAETMEIHSLKIDALLARSLGISLQGETRSAGEHVVTALSLSTLYGLQLRAVFAMTRLGALISMRPGYESQGQRLLKSALAMAEAYDYQPAREAIGERLLRQGGLDGESW